MHKPSENTNLHGKNNTDRATSKCIKPSENTNLHGKNNTDRQNIILYNRLTLLLILSHSLKYDSQK